MALSLQVFGQQMTTSLWPRDSPTWMARGLQGSESSLLELDLEITVVT